MKRIFNKWLQAKLFGTMLFLIVAGVCQARTIHVPSEFSTIQAGIDTAVNGDLVLVSSGIYTSIGNKNLDFKGKAITVQSQNGQHETIIDCQGEGRGLFFHSGEGINSRFSGFTIKNGRVDDDSPYGGKGGGIYIYNSSPTISNCIVSQCRAEGFGGGGITLNTSSARIENTIIENNLAETCGGGLYIFDSASPTIYNTIIRKNKTSGASSGGGVCVIRSHPVLSRCTISYNESNLAYVGEGVTNSGGISFRDGSTGKLESSIISYNKAQERGGIGSWDAIPEITNCLIEKNEATVDGGGGIGLYNNSNALVSNSTIKNNTANGYGGGVSIWNPVASNTGPVFIDNIIENNDGGESGGGMNILDSSPEISRCIIRGNRSSTRAGIALRGVNGTTSSTLVNDLIYDNVAAGFGGGITCLGGAGAAVTNCTVVNNRSSIVSAGLYVEDANVSVVNSILWGNIPEDDSTIDARITYSDISGVHPDVGNFSSDPQFMSSTDFHLENDSPCIDTGNNSANHSPLLDLGRNNREDGEIDIGVYEYPYTEGGPGVHGKIGADIDAPGFPSNGSNIPSLLLLLLQRP